MELSTTSLATVDLYDQYSNLSDGIFTYCRQLLITHENFRRLISITFGTKPWKSMPLIFIVEGMVDVNNFNQNLSIVLLLFQAKITLYNWKPDFRETPLNLGGIGTADSVFVIFQHLFYILFHSSILDWWITIHTLWMIKISYTEFWRILLSFR